MKLRMGRTQRVEFWEGKRRAATFYMKNVKDGSYIDVMSAHDFNREMAAHSLLILCVALLDDYLKLEATALLELVDNDLADGELREWRARQKGEPPLPF